ncbi:hypothetical protein ACHAXR_012450 [Thalassiosira sp. AJA248-18]
MFVATAHLASTRAFTRYAFAVQYLGGNLLGFSYQGRKGENCIVYEKHSGQVQSDLRGIESVEGRIRRALGQLVGLDNYRNIKVSSRTDRGVHAWRNTFQADIRPRLATNQPIKAWCPKNLVHGLNFHLARLPSNLTNEHAQNEMNANHQDGRRRQQSLKNDICVVSSAIAPATTIPNIHFDPNLPENEDNPKNFPWDVRFTASRRTYAYQILHSYDTSDDDGGLQSQDNLHRKTTYHTTSCYQAQPFEHDRVWRIHETERNKRLDINAMIDGCKHFVGTHDFTSFRGKGCQRSSPIVTLEDVWVGQERYHDNCSGGILSGVWRRKLEEEEKNGRDGYASPPRMNLPSLHTPKTLFLTTIVITGKSFLYHQVRNIVACLVDVGRGRLKPHNVKEILEKKDRGRAPGMAPAKGLFLVDVEHGDFRF